MTIFDGIDRAIADIAAGRAVVVVDSEDRENEGDLIFAAELATPELMGFLVRYSSGYVCVALEAEDCLRLDLPPMRAINEDRHDTAYTVTVDARSGVSTGISASDRARTARLLASAETVPGDFTRPGHVVPLRARAGGVLTRPGHTESAVDLARLAGLRPAGVICEIVSEDDPTTMARTPELRRFADEHGLAMITIEALQAWRRANEVQVVHEAAARIPTPAGTMIAHGYRDVLEGVEHVAMVAGDITGEEPVTVRIHSECLTGDVFHSLRCDCGPQLDAAVAAVCEEGRGVVLYMRGHEGRGIGLVQKLRAYQLQDDGRDTVDANLDLGLPADARDFSLTAQILRDLGVSRVRLMTNNPAKADALRAGGVEVVERVPTPTNVTPENLRYLRTKRDRMGHLLEGLDEGLGAGPTQAPTTNDEGVDPR